MCSTVPPKNSPFQTPLGQTSMNPSGLFAQSPQTLFNAGDPANFPQQQANATQQIGNPSLVKDFTKNPMRSRAGGFGGMPRGGPRYGIMNM